MGNGPSGFIERKCPFVNCYVTGDANLLGDYTKFDVLAFLGPEIVRAPRSSLPVKRSSHQKFVFATIESADNYPVCDRHLDGFFNWTWTYRLDSDARWGYLVVRDRDNNVIGPNKVMHWMKLEDMDPVSDDLKKRLKSKSKAAAWFVSNCYTRSHREDFVGAVRKHLTKYNLTVDVYGQCGPLKCSRDDMSRCLNKIQTDYYFYFSFENSFSEDYVTEKLTYPLQNDAVPVVYGGANYTRFMPDGIYLNAKELGAEELARTMHAIINDPERYYQFFRWQSHYSFHRRQESVETDDYCRFCSMLNDEELVKRTTVYRNFKEWWTPPGKC
ncbi:Alpha-(1,3)-fucosyltransferase C [Eumeta japonica]|uniref:Fucosyltransferase n=1 Tax=Eumeta variegata TaxID=151549 RepID=A0A4C1ZFN3_EUMVA|nr:Alpha-(1,3)-fucosyltransferase C [Eumeta japonica]